MTRPAASFRHTPAGRRSTVPRALLAIAAVVMLAGAALAGCGRLASTASRAAFTPSATPVLPYRPMVSIAQAWGLPAATATFSTQLDASHVLALFSLSADGRRLYGYEVTLVNRVVSAAFPAQAGFLDIASHQFTPIGVASQAKCVGNSCQYGPPLIYLDCCQSDGRYLIAISTGYPGPNCGGCVWSYDQVTGALYEVAAGNQYQGIQNTLMAHGVLAIKTGVGILIADLAARTLAQLPGTTGGTLLDAFSWPYLLYGSPPTSQETTITPTPLRVYDLARRTAIPLPQVAGSILALDGATLYYLATSGAQAGGASSGVATLDELDRVNEPGAQPRVLARLPSGPGTGLPQSLAIAGDTLFYAVTTGLPPANGCLGGAGRVCPTEPPAPPPATTLYELDGHLASSPQVRALGAYTANLGGFLAANARLVVLQGAAWDRAEGRFVALESSAALSSNTYGLWQGMAGNLLMLGHRPPGDLIRPIQISIFDTAHLSVLTG